MAEVISKGCSNPSCRCKEPQPFAAFTKGADKYGLQPYCRVCNNEYSTRRYKSHPEKRKRHNKRSHGVASRACKRLNYIFKEWVALPPAERAAHMVEQRVIDDAWKCPKCEETDVSLMASNGGRWCKPCDNARSMEKDAALLRAHTRLEITQTEFRALPRETRAAERVNQRTIDAASDNSTPGPFTPERTSEDPQLLADRMKAKHQRDQFEEAQARNPVGWVYVIWNPAWPDSVKIGTALDWEERLASLQTSDPERAYKLVAAFRSKKRYDHEKMAHDYFRAHRVQPDNGKKPGEWFRLSRETAVIGVEYICKQEEQHDDAISRLGDGQPIARHDPHLVCVSG